MLNGQPSPFYLCPCQAHNHASAPESVGRVPHVPYRVICREHPLSHRLMCFPDVSVSGCLILPVRSHLLGCFIGHTLVMSGIKSRLHIRPEDVVTLPRVHPLVSMLLKEVVHILQELLLCCSFLCRLCQAVKELLKHLKACVSGYCECFRPALVIKEPVLLACQCSLPLQEPHGILEDEVPG